MKKDERRDDKRRPIQGRATYPVGNVPFINLDLARNKGNTSNLVQTKYFWDGGNATTKRKSINFSECSVLTLDVYNVTPKNDSGKWDTMIKSLFSTLKAANNGRVSYTLADVGNYVLTTSELHTLSALLHRCYKAVNMYDTLDASVPELIFSAMGEDIVTWRENIADARMMIYNLDKKIARNFPLHIPLFDRKKYIFGEVFREGREVKTPYYIINTEAILPIIKSGSPLAPIRGAFSIRGGNSATATGMTYSTLASAVSQIMTAVDTYEEYSSICSDIMKTYGQGAIYKARILPEVLIDYKGVHDEDMLQQIHNAHLFGVVSHLSNGNAGFSQYSDNGNFGVTGYKYDWRFQSPQFSDIDSSARDDIHDLIDRDFLIGTPDNNPSKERVISLPAFACKWDATLTVGSGGGLTGMFYCQVVGTELAKSATYFSKSTESALYGQCSPTQVCGITGYQMNYASGTQAVANVLKIEGEIRMKMGVFQYHPRYIKNLSIVQNNLVNGESAWYYEDWDYFNTANIDNEHLENLHSLFIEAALTLPVKVRDVRLETLTFEE